MDQDLPRRTQWLPARHDQQRLVDWFIRDQDVESEN
jgi:hypothetical protein